ncbi:hypothetical protein ABVY47_004475 [Vibrio parahaemolyticus]|uniref:hypothetical protein n=1 Tax=Vibrio vulnificus TaxID=672 RepID=UPI000CCFD807|nr:hypothetical protein [Vibrio vulnificus]EJC6794243.1 hypothetical protein [Vibrio parahaemolyticus]EHH0795852.1 hypothetical protein [Vibrio vulnificus]EHH0804919.1 hypothetical protein [Vibrio vulnificus]EIT7028554.1 hypothetical protein [Vibrio vulnificus]EJC6850839.1 hypothetical protein [Vibrio parahaemolyticus]
MMKNLVELVLDNSEVVVDQFTESDWVKDIPIVGNAFKLMAAHKELKNSMFNAKVTKFLSSLHETGITQRAEFTNFFMANSDEKARVGQSVMLSVDNMNDLEKCHVLANWFAAYIGENITESEFRRGCDVISKLFIDDLLDFISGKHEYSLLETLIGTDLVRIEGGLIIDEEISSIEAVVSTFGNKFRSVMSSISESSKLYS